MSKGKAPTLITSGNTALANTLVERDMSKGYTWGKFLRCWTNELSVSRFFPRKEDSNGVTLMPAAFFTQLVIYDIERGWYPMEVKFQGSEAEALEVIKSKGRIALLSCEGHLYVKVQNGYRGQVVHSTFIIKEGTTVIHAEEAQTGTEGSKLSEHGVASQLPAPEGLEDAGEEFAGVQDGSVLSSLAPGTNLVNSDDVDQVFGSEDGQMDDAPF